MMSGKCPQCGKVHVRPAPCDVAVCTCTNNPTLVPLKVNNTPSKNLLGNFQRQYPLGCPQCNQPMKYLGLNNWECTNPKCDVIQLHLNTNELKIDRIIRAAIL